MAALKTASTTPVPHRHPSMRYKDLREVEKVSSKVAAAALARMQQLQITVAGSLSSLFIHLLN